MRYLTDRKRATGMGSAKSGTAHFWAMKVSSVALLILIPLFVFTFGAIVGEDYATVIAYFAHPFPALIAALTLIVGFEHFQSCLLYTSPSPRDLSTSRMPSSA